MSTIKLPEKLQAINSTCRVIDDRGRSFFARRDEVLYEQDIAFAAELVKRWNEYQQCVDTLKAVQRLDYLHEHSALAEMVKAALALAGKEGEI